MEGTVSLTASQRTREIFLGPLIRLWSVLLLISQNQLLLIEVGAESELMFKESGRQTNEITFFFFFDDVGTSNQRGKRGEVWGGGEYEGEKVLQDPFLVHKSQRHGRFSPEQRHRDPFTKARERESKNNKRTREKEKHEQDKALTGKETAQSAALTRVGTHPRLAQAPAGE